MDEEIIDTVRADSLEAGDSIEWWDDGESLGVKSLKSIEDNPV